MFTIHTGIQWGSVVVKALRYWSGGPGIESLVVVHWECFSVVPPTEPCALRSTQPLKVNTRVKVAGAFG